MSHDRSSLRGALLVAALAGVAVMSGCTASGIDPSPTSSAQVPAPGPSAPFVDAGPAGVRVTDGDDWTLPAWVRPPANSGFFSEESSPRDEVNVHSVDVSWRQVQPSAGAIDRRGEGEAQGMHFDSLAAQLDQPGEFWMRIFATGEDWAPRWVVDDCAVSTYGPDYDGQRHLPIWNECVWTHLLDTYRALFIESGLADDPRLRFVYVPGGFTWAEFDYDIISAATATGDLDEQQYLSWYSHAWTDLVALFSHNAHKLVFTGEDYPFGPFGTADDLLTQQATAAGMGIRTGITELFNFHLNEAPAYGSRIQPDGHLLVDESLPIHDGRYVVATENECYNDCGYQTDDPYYAVRQSNLKALQLRMNWIYVVPGPSYMAEYPELWDWVRLSLGQTASTSADAWADLRDAEDRYWVDNELGRFEDPAKWPSLPYVRNLERWLVQVDEPGSVAHRCEADVHRNVLEDDNGTAYEGLSTNVAAGDSGFVFDLDPRFAKSVGSSPVVKVTFLDRGTSTFSIQTGAGDSAAVALTDSGDWRTATIALPDGALSGARPRLRIAVPAAGQDLVVRFVRVIRVSG